MFEPPLPDPLKTPPSLSQWAKLQNFFADPSHASTKEMSVKLEKVLAI